MGEGSHETEGYVANPLRDCLTSGTDKTLPQITRMRDLLSRGIGVHHGGLLPIVKGKLPEP